MVSQAGYGLDLSSALPTHMDVGMTFFQWRANSGLFSEVTAKIFPDGGQKG